MSNTLDQYREQYLAVLRFQNGDPEGALLLLDRFSDFLEGFVLLLRGQSIKRLTYSHRIFLSNFIKNGLAKALKSKFPVPAAYIAAENALISISTQLKPIDEEDIRQEVQELFIATLKRYRSRNEENYLVPYILKSFPYALTRRVQQLIKDPLVNLASDKIISLDIPVNDFRNDNRISDYRSIKIQSELTYDFSQIQQLIGDDELDNAWLRGDNCDSAFDNLSYSERKILKSFYFLEYTDAMIAQQLGVSYNTAIRKRHHIEAKMRGIYVQPQCQYCDMPITKSTLGRQPRQCVSCRQLRKVEQQRIRQARLDDL